MLPWISPAFLDLQVNGYQGDDYSSAGLGEESIVRLVDNLARSGTAHHVATIVTAPEKGICRSLTAIGKATRENAVVREAVLGIHVEGPFISELDGPRGAHNKAFLRDPDFDEFRRWQDHAEGKIIYVTVAPERKGALQFIERVVASGVAVAIGHTAATEDEIRAAIAAGATLSTHLGNGSHAMLPRHHNYIWEQLAADELAAGVISDGFHLPPAVVRVIARVKRPSQIYLVSDVVKFGGMEPGQYDWNGTKVEVFPDGHVGLAGTELLAGAGHLLDWGLPHFIKFSGLSLGESIGYCTSVPARLVKLEPLFGQLEPGAPAHLVLFDYKLGDDRLRVVETIRAGATVYRCKVDSTCT
jgi:N-acetylglucosamine-6-phosphate deacetylase